jgi:Flp pilus assembly protein TadD
LLAGANNDLGYLWADEGRNLDRAEKMIRMALKLEGDNPAYLDSMGWVLFKRQRYSEAKEYLQRAATAKSADDPVVWDHLGDAMLQLGDKQGAASAWEKSVEYYSKGLHNNPKEKADGVRRKLQVMTGASATNLRSK